MSAGFVETQELSKRYGSFVALDRCSLRIESGEIHGLLGPNGAGKTTLIRLLMGFIRPSGGRAHIAGLDCYRQSVQVHRHVTYLPGDARLFRTMRARDVLQFFAEARGHAVSRSVDLAERLKLDVSRRVALMSTGMRQKLALAVTMAAPAALMILDEPTANLDPNVRSDVMKLVAEARESGQTILFSSHVLSEIEEACDRVSILRSGRLVHTQVMADLRRRHRVRARLVADLPELPSSIRDEITVCHVDEDRLLVETPGELSPILGWLARLPIDEVTIEPIGLRAVYDRFHTKGGDGEVGSQRRPSLATDYRNPFELDP